MPDADWPITAVDVACYRVPLPEPESDGTLEWDALSMVLVRVHAGETVGTGWTYAPAAVGHLVEEQLTPVVVGGDAWDIPRTHRGMVAAVRNTNRPGAASYSISAVDVALWDLKARLLDVSLPALLGAARPDVPVYASGGFTSLQGPALDRQVEEWVGRGFPRLKVKVGRDVGGDPERIRHVRRAAGPGPEVFVDANGGYTEGQAIRLDPVFREADVTWLEEPVSSDDLAGLARVRDRVAPDVTAGEYGTHPGYFRAMAPVVDCLQIDASRCGGITGWQAAAAVADAHGVEVSAHCAPMLHLAVAGATPHLRHIEWFADHEWFESRYLDGFVAPRDGTATPRRDVPGHGLTTKLADLEEYRT